MTGLPVGLDVSALLARLAAGDATALATLLTVGPAKLVTADPNRRMLTQKQIVAEHFNTGGTPVGHGYTQQNLDSSTAYYSFDKGPLHCISLDTVNLNGYDDGSLDHHPARVADQRADRQQLALPRHLRPVGQRAAAPTS